MNGTATVLEVEGLAKRWVRRGLIGPTASHEAVHDVTFTVHAGERVGLIGESGSGKTTLARMCLGLVPPDAGRIVLFGEDTRTWSRRRWRDARHQVQLLFQDPRAMLNPGMRIGQLLRESARLHRRELSARDEVERVLQEVGLQGRADAFPHQLSGGEQRRAGIARTLLARPRLVVADEPTAGLDAALKASLVDLLLHRLGPECALILITHDLPMVAWATERLLVLHEGHIVDDLATPELFLPTRHPHTLALLDAAGLRADPADGPRIALERPLTPPPAPDRDDVDAVEAG